MPRGEKKWIGHAKVPSTGIEYCEVYKISSWISTGPQVLGPRVHCFYLPDVYMFVVVLTITVTWLLPNPRIYQCHLPFVYCYWLYLTSQLSMETPYSNSSSVKCSSSSCLYSLTLCLYISEYVRTFVLGTLKIK